METVHFLYLLNPQDLQNGIFNYFIIARLLGVSLNESNYMVQDFQGLGSREENP